MDGSPPTLARRSCSKFFQTGDIQAIRKGRLFCAAENLTGTNRICRFVAYNRACARVNPTIRLVRHLPQRLPVVSWGFVQDYACLSRRT